MNVVEPLAESCDWLSAVAEFTCAADRELAWSRDQFAPVQDTSCAWYHGNWQYLRLLDLVSNPANHSDFYGAAFQRAAGQLNSADVLICGAADYSMLAHVCCALGPSVRPVVVELCRTPLIANDWYALRTGTARPTLIQGDACADLPVGDFDVVVSDSFLPRIEQANLVPMLQNWRGALRPGGSVVTTVRIAEPGESDRQQFIDLFTETVESSASWLPSVTRRSADELAKRAASWVRREEATAFYGVDAVVEVFRAAGFSTVDSTDRQIGRKRYAEIVAVR